MAQAQLEVAAEKGTLEGTVPATAAQLPATAQANPNDLVNRLNICLLKRVVMKMVYSCRSEQR